MMKRISCWSYCLLTILATTALTSWADPGIVWHEPAYAHPDLSGPTMRDPIYEAADNDLTIYQGFWKGAGDANGNQTGGALYYRFASGTWTNVSLNFHSNVGESQYWKATLPSVSAGATNVIEYYVRVNFDGVTGSNPDTTYLYGNDLQGNFTATTNEAAAQASPYSIRNRPGWITHNNNRIIAGNDIQVRLKTGYIGPDNDTATLWATDGAIYYTTDGSDPAGSLGTASNTSSAVALSFDGIEGDASGNGNAAYWEGNMTNVLFGLPTGGQVKYKVGLWNTANNEEKFGDHSAGTENAIFTYQNGQLGDPALTVNGLNANYTTTKLFIDEIADDLIDLDIIFQPGESNVVAAEIYSNLNRRDRADIDANGDGYADGISGLDGGSLVAGDDSYYYKAYTMTNAGAGTYTLTIPANKTGAYRLTARWKVDGDPNWRWYTNIIANRRDHAITVSPKDARDIRLYEINVFNIDASGDTFAQRSTLEDLHDAPGAAQSSDGNWNLDYLKSLGMNWLWFQPIHPNGIDGREPNDGWGGSGDPYDPGSPYAVKNFFEVNELMSINYSGGNSLEQNRAASMVAWSNFVAASDSEEVGIMLDAPFNHTAFDIELAQQGVDLFQPDGASWSPTNEIRHSDARFFSADGNYGNRASSATNIAAGPDRFDFGKWNDVKDVFFGRYDSLVEIDSEPERSSYINEGDWFDTTDTNWTNNDFVQNGTNKNVTKLVWKYFAEYAVHWLEKTRPAGLNRNSIPADGDVATRYDWDAKGIDGLRCDFGQGLPPRCWEYIINVARSHKWNFVMMSESLDGGAVTYRSNRHFDILNENIVFPLKSATDYTAYRNIFEDRRNAYGEGLVLLNNTSHDEETVSDPWESVVRSAAVGMMDGTTMIFPGQELGISTTYGYDQYETNFGKQVPHFKRWNSMVPIWTDTNYGNDQLFKVYSGIQSARASSPALRSSNRWFLDGDGFNSKIFATVKYEEPNALANGKDVVIAFANLDRNNDQSDNFKIPTELANLIGLDDTRLYNVVNIAAYERPPAIINKRNTFLWGSPESGADLKDSGLFVSLYKVPIANSDWDAIPYEAQYLKLVDVTDPLDVNIDSIDTSGSNVTVTCASTPGWYYHLDARTNMLSGSWTTILSNVKAEETSLALPHAGGASSEERFYRIRTSYVEQ